MMSTHDKSRCMYLLILIVIDVCCLWTVSGFSDGGKLAKGSAATRTIYCNRQPNRRAPMHFNPSCNGYCEPRSDFEQFYTLSVSNDTYWLDVVRVNISAKPNSGKSLTGFSVYAIDKSGHVAGSFVEDDTNVIVGTCNDIMTNTDETHAAFHKMADHGRKNVSIQWQPDGYNHGRVKFVLYVVNNHSDIYSVESQWLTSQKHGDAILDVRTTLDKIVSAIDISMFEDTFKYRSTKGYNLDLSNPFSVFSKSPSKNDLVPANISRSNGGSNLNPGNGTLVTSGGSGTNGHSTLEVAAVNGTSGVHDGSVPGNREMNVKKITNVNDTNLYSMKETNMNNENDTNLYSMNKTNMNNENNTNLYSMNKTNMNNENDTNLYSMNKTNMNNEDDTNLNSMNITNMNNVNGTNLYKMNETNINNVNDTNLYKMNDTNTNSMNDTNLYKMNDTNTNSVNDTNPYKLNETNFNNVNDTNLYKMNDTNTDIENNTSLYEVNETNLNNVKNVTVTSGSKGSQTTQLGNNPNSNILYTTQVPDIVTDGSQLTALDNNAQLNTPFIPTDSIPYPGLSGSQTAAFDNNNPYTVTNTIPDPPGSNFQNPALENQPILSTAGNTSDTSPFSNPTASEVATTTDKAGYSTSVYPDIPDTNRSGSSIPSPAPNASTSSNGVGVIGPFAM